MESHSKSINNHHCHMKMVHNIWNVLLKAVRKFFRENWTNKTCNSCFRLTIASERFYKVSMHSSITIVKVFTMLLKNRNDDNNNPWIPFKTRNSMEKEKEKKTNKQTKAFFKKNICITSAIHGIWCGLSAISHWYNVEDRNNDSAFNIINVDIDREKCWMKWRWDDKLTM